MMSVQLARYLKDFSAPQRRPMRFEQTPFAADTTFASPDQVEPVIAGPQVDVEAERAEAFAEGRAEAEAEMSERHSREIAELEARHKQAMDEARALYEDKFAAEIADQFSKMTALLADLVASQTAHVLTPVMDDVLAEKAVADLAIMVRSGLQAGEGLSVTVKGPKRLFDLLKARFEENTPVFRHEEADDLDLTVEFGETVLVTRMAAWADTVRKVLA